MAESWETIRQRTVAFAQDFHNLKFEDLVGPRAFRLLDSQVVTTLEASLEKAKGLFKVDIANLPRPQLVRLDDISFTIRRIIDLLKQAETADPESKVPRLVANFSRRLHEQLMDEAPRKIVSGGAPTILDPVAASAADEGRLSQLEATVKSIGTRLESISAAGVERARQELEKFPSEAEQVLRNIRTAAETAGITAEAVHFSSEAKRHEAQAKTWLTTTIVLAATTLLYVLGLAILYAVFGTPDSTAETIQIGLLKAIAFSLLITATIWSGQIYRANQHNAVVNRQRENSLGTFQALRVRPRLQKPGMLS